MSVEIEAFVSSLAIPAERKAIVLAELSDHVACAVEAAVRKGADPDAAARAALGDLGALRRSLEAIEPAFRLSRRHAMVRAVIAGVLVAIVVDQFGTVMMGVAASLAAIAIAVALAPPHVLDHLRAELRAPRIPGTLGAKGLPIGPALVYGFTLMSTPFLVWIGMIVARAYGGALNLDVPWSAFALLIALWMVLVVEGIRARHRATA